MPRSKPQYTKAGPVKVINTRTGEVSEREPLTEKQLSKVLRSSAANEQIILNKKRGDFTVKPTSLKV